MKCCVLTLLLYQRPDPTDVCTTFEPQFDGVIGRLYDVVDIMVTVSKSSLCGQDLLFLEKHLRLRASQ